MSPRSSLEKKKIPNLIISNLSNNIMGVGGSVLNIYFEGNHK